MTLLLFVDQSLGMRVMMKTRIAYRSTQVEGTSRYTIVRHWMFVMGLFIGGPFTSRSRRDGC